ncbi:MAG: PAS-domain containing protein, partial [Pseudomonadota bacterium]
MSSFINIADTARTYDAQHNSAEERLSEWQLQTYYRNLPIVLAGMTVGALILVTVFWTYFESALLIGWLCMHTAMVGYRAHHYLLYREQGISPDDLPIWRRQAFLGPLAGGLVWAAVVLLLMPTLALPGRMLLVFIIGGFSAAAVGITSAYLPSLYAWALTAQLTLTLMAFGTATTPTEFSMGLMLALFTVALLFFGNSSSRSMRQSFIDANSRAALQSRVSRLEATTRSAIENMPAAVALFDEADRLMVWNRRAVKLFPELRTRWRIGTTFNELAENSPSWRSIGSKGQDANDLSERLERHQNPDRSWEVA